MNIRHLKCFLVLAEELNFTRAAERLHIEPSPLSRTIKELETELGVLLFKRDRRGTCLTYPGTVFLTEVKRVFVTLDNAKQSVQAAASGYRSTLRIALSDGAAVPHLAAILAHFRADLPDIVIRATEVPLSEQLLGLRNEVFDVGFSRSKDVGDSIIAKPIWRDSLVATLPARHPLLAYQKIPLNELLHYPLVMSHPELHAGYNQQVRHILRSADTELSVAEHVTSMDMLLTLVAAGYGLGLVPLSHLEISNHPQVVVRSLDIECSALTTYLLTPATKPSPQLAAFIEYVLETVK